MGRYSFGQPVRRLEDVRFVTGTGRYAEDIRTDNESHGVFMRSPVAHADITSVNIERARKSPGVLAVYTGRDWREAGLRNIPIRSDFKSRDGSAIRHPLFPCLATDRVRFVGQPIAMVVADTRAQAEDARDLIECEFSDLPSVASAEVSRREEAPTLHVDVPGNLCFDWENGDETAVDEALEKSEHVIEYSMYNNRVVVSPMENRGCCVSIDNDIVKLEGAIQNVFTFRGLLASVFGDDESNYHVAAPDVGGGFGAKNQMQPEHVMCVFAARQLNRSVRWVNSRSETFLTDSQGRDVRHTARLGLDKNLRFTAMKVLGVADMGAYLSTNGPVVPTVATAAVLGGPYEIPNLYMNVKGYFSNSTPTDAYRGAGRPEANFITERMVEVAARELDVSAVELRRKNLISVESLPYTNAFGKVIDSGAFEVVMDKALELIQAQDFGARAIKARAAGKLRGLGVASYLESTLGGPSENARIQIQPDGAVHLMVGTQSNGQSHETVFSQLVADRLGIDIQQIKFSQASTGIGVPMGGGHGGSRSLQICGSAIFGATDQIIEKGQRIAAHLLEAAIADIEFDTQADALEGGNFVVKGTDRKVSLSDVANAAARGEGLESDEARALDEINTYDREAFTYPNGCHAVEIEIDPKTGEIEIVDYKIVDDFGKIVNPLVVTGQIVGGVVQGLGQAVMEKATFDESGQLLAGSFMDYCLPRADDFPADFEVDLFEDAPPETNPLGIKGCGEAGCVASTVAMVNAVTDALRAGGVENADAIEMPLTPDKLWRAVRDGRV